MAAKSYVIGSTQTAVGKVNDTLQIVLTIAIVAIVGYVIWNLLKAVKAGGKAIGNTIDNVVVQQTTGIPIARQKALQQLAENAHKAIWGNKGIFGIFWNQSTEDENLFIDALNKLRTVGEVNIFCAFYKEIDGNSCRADALSYLSEKQRARVINTVLNNLS